MAYLDFEEAVDTGQPIELYLFENLEERFTYTSGQETVSYVGRIYTPIPLKRTSPEIQTTQPDRRIVIEMPITNEFAQRYVTTLPASPDKAIVYRYHSTDGAPEVVQFFRGEVVNVAFVEDRAKVNCVTNARILNNPIPQQTCRNLCNHVLYDNRCGVSQSSYTLATTVIGISANGLRVTLTGTNLSSKSSGNFYNSGVMSRNSIENRMVLKTEDLGGDQVTFDVLLPFQFLESGTMINISAGCRHSLNNCDNRFNNVQRYGGFPYVPRKNPFGMKVTGGS